MELPADRVGPYVRALRAGLHILAPGDDHVPLGQAAAHLRALDPGLSGALLFPAEIDDRSGLPSFVWMERAIAEQALAREADPAADGAADDMAEVNRLSRLDPALGERMRQRAALHTHLRGCRLLPTARLVVTPRRRGTLEVYSVIYDCLAPSGLWVRVRADLTGPRGWASGLLVTRSDGTVRADPGVRHLFTRHVSTPLLPMAAQLAAGTGARVSRLCRAAVGPFWFPGFPLPDAAPRDLAGGLLLHLHGEVLGEDVRRSMQRDPLQPHDPGERPPEGMGIFRERRFAASPPLMSVVDRWAADRGCQVSVVPLTPRRM